MFSLTFNPVLVTRIKLRSRPTMCKNAHPFLWWQNWFIKPSQNKIQSLLGSYLQGKFKKLEYGCQKPNIMCFFKRCKMQNLIGPIVKNAEIFHKNIFIPFFHVVLGPKRFLGGLPHENSKKNLGLINSIFMTFLCKRNQGYAILHTVGLNRVKIPRHHHNLFCY